MGKRIAIVGAGAVGCYAGGYMVRAGEDVTFIDGWPAHVEHMRNHGLRVTGVTADEDFTVPVRALHISDVPQLSREAPIDIAFVCMKSYDTEWATMMIRPYLSADGIVVSLQNCMNEEAIAHIVGWGRTLGCIASQIQVALYDPGHVERGGAKGGAEHVVFRLGEMHGRRTARAEEACRLVAHADSAILTDNLWGERWSKLVANVMQNGMSAATGLSSNEILDSEPLRRFSARLGSEAIRVGQALGYALEEILHLEPETIARAGEGDAAAMRTVDEVRAKDAGKRSGKQRPSMGQDMLKNRRTEIDFLNGYVVRKAEEVGLPALANARLTEIVSRIERGELKPDPKLLTDLKLN